MAGSTIKSLKKSIENVSYLKAYMKSYANHIDNVNAKLKEFMTGDGTDSYWEGEAAYSWFEKAIGSKGLKNVIANYNNSFIEFKQYAKKIERANIKNKSKGMAKSAVSGRIQSCTGSTYTNGVPADKSDKNIPAVLSTVSQDAVNDDQNAASTRACDALKQALGDLVVDFDNLNRKWNDVVNNTTGSLQQEARNIIESTNKRKKQVNNLINELESEYIGDMLFS